MNESVPDVISFNDKQHGAIIKKKKPLALAAVTSVGRKIQGEANGEKKGKTVDV